MRKRISFKDLIQKINAEPVCIFCLIVLDLENDSYAQFETGDLAHFACVPVCAL